MLAEPRELMMLLPSIRILAIVLGLLALASCASTGVVPRSGAPVPPLQLSEGQIVAAVNGARAANGGHKAMSYNPKLEAACRTQLRLMVEKDQLAHDLGMKLRERVTGAGYVGAVGENLAGGQSSIEGAIEGWLNSPGHRATLLSDKFTEFGLAVARVPAERKSRYGIYWCFIAGGPFEAWRTVVTL